MKTTKFIFLLFTLLNSVAANIIASPAVFAQTPISDCINSLLYTDTSFGRQRSKVSEQTASRVCTGVKTEQESQSVKSCFKSLLYRETSFGSQRTDTSEETAIQACTIARDTPTPPTNTGVILVPIPNKPTQSPEAVAKCMRQLLYTRKLVCTRTGFPSCSSIPSEGFAGWQTQDVRTEISEDAAAKACS
jgi:hypothetical protein